MDCISIDWLQLHVKIRSKNMFDGEKSLSGGFKIVKKDIRHNVFSDHREIQSAINGQWEACAVLSYTPLSGILPQDSGHIKIINKYLYQSDLRRFVTFLIAELGLTFHSISRLDISNDFLTFHKKLTVPRFFNAVLSKKVLKRRATSIGIEGFASRSLPIHYMRFGTKNNDAQFYIYNKSKELREKTDKPYIREKWAKHDLVFDDVDVWRMEFVLHPSKYGMVEVGVGEAIEFNDLRILDTNYQQDLFYALLGRFAEFVVNDGQVRKERMKPVVLFNSPGRSELKYIRVSEKQTSTRMDKVFIKKMYILAEQWRLHNKDEPLTKDLLQQFIDNKDLQKWFDERMMLTNKLNYHDANPLQPTTPN